MGGLWECSCCGGVVSEARPPERCSECGTAGTFFAAEPDYTHALDAEDSVLLTAWLQAIRAERRERSPRRRADRRSAP